MPENVQLSVTRMPTQIRERVLSDSRKTNVTNIRIEILTQGGERAAFWIGETPSRLVLHFRRIYMWLCDINSSRHHYHHRFCNYGSPRAGLPSSSGSRRRDRAGLRGTPVSSARLRNRQFSGRSPADGRIHPSEGRQDRETRDSAFGREDLDRHRRERFARRANPGHGLETRAGSNRQFSGAWSHTKKKTNTTGIKRGVKIRSLQLGTTFPSGYHSLPDHVCGNCC